MDEKMKSSFAYQSPVGILVIELDADSLLRLDFAKEELPAHEELSALASEVTLQLDEYFSGKRKTFTLPLNPQGTPFQKECWNILSQIPYGDTISYKEEAIKSGNAQAFRAVANANGRNPIAIIIPCHRVISSNKTLGGYGGGLDKKMWLLNHEKSYYNS